MNEKPVDIKSSLARDLMEPIYHKLDTRLQARVQGKKGWNLNLTPLQAKAYYTFFEDLDLRSGWQYEHYIIQGHLAEINRIYA